MGEKDLSAELGLKAHKMHLETFLTPESKLVPDEECQRHRIQLEGAH